MVREFSFDELEANKPNRLELSERFTRRDKVRRKPRSPEEEELLRQRIVRAVREAEAEGKMIYDGTRIEIRL